MTKNFTGLKKIDFFADSVSLTMNGGKTHATRTGGCLTILLFLTMLAYWVWGTLKCFAYYQPQLFSTVGPPILTSDIWDPYSKTSIQGY
jgi:hypothetical protein